MSRTLLIIFAFIAFMLGNFIWFVVTWQADKEAPIGGRPAAAKDLL